MPSTGLTDWTISIDNGTLLWKYNSKCNRLQVVNGSIAIKQLLGIYKQMGRNLDMGKLREVGKEKDLTWLVDEMNKNNTLLWVTDGSYNKNRAPNVTVAGWVV